jgi:quercetin dioxygenase-like cupin family protein
MTFVPLTRRPERQVHEGYEWLYVLSGQLRLLLGEHDLILMAGEVSRLKRSCRWAPP